VADASGSGHHLPEAPSIPRSAYLSPTGERLRETRLRRLLDFVAEVEAAAVCDRPELIALLATGLRRLVECDDALLTGFDPRTQSVVTTAGDPRIAALRGREPELWSGCLGHHPTVVEFNRTGGGVPLRFSDLLSVRAYRRLPIYKYFFRPFGVEYKIDVRVWPTSHHVDVGCCRQRRDFDQQDAAVLDALRPYLTVVLRRAEDTALRDRMRELFALTPREGDVLALLVRGHGVRQIARELVLAEGTVRKHVEHVHAKLGTSSRTQVIARILNPAAASPEAAEAVREALERLGGHDAIPVHALTAREVEVLTLAAAGDTNEQIATKLGARPQTIKKHLDHVYAKLHVTGRGPAVARMLSLHRVGAPVNLQT
jgi:DNA-binding NarL/FixJ family response regulator